MAVVDIRKAKPKDLHGILALQKSLAIYDASTEPTVRSTPTANRKRALAARREFRKKSSQFLIATDGKRIIGYAWANVLSLDGPFSEKQIGKICEVYVDEQYRRQGVGRAMVEEQLLWLRKKKVHFVEANAYTGNLKARGFFQSQGFYINAFRHLKKI